MPNTFGHDAVKFSSKTKRRIFSGIKPDILNVLDTQYKNMFHGNFHTDLGSDNSIKIVGIIHLKKKGL